jgi:hypothetical protein
MKLGIFGSRSLSDARVRAEIANFLNEHPEYDVIVTTQEPKGVCSLAQKYAKENAVMLELHFLNIKRYARGAFEHRSDDVIKRSDFILLIHDGESKGTSNELSRVKHFNKPFKYVILEKTTTLHTLEDTDILKDKELKGHAGGLADIDWAFLEGLSQETL